MRGTGKLLRSGHTRCGKPGISEARTPRRRQGRCPSLTALKFARLRSQRATIPKVPFNRLAAEFCAGSFGQGHAQPRSCRAPRAGDRQRASRRVGQVRYTPPGCDEHRPSRAIPFLDPACSNETPCATKPRDQAEAVGFVPVILVRDGRRSIAGATRYFSCCVVPRQGHAVAWAVAEALCSPTDRVRVNAGSRAGLKSLCSAVSVSKPLALAIHPGHYLAASGFACGAALFLPNSR
jgi:hypothetical protein